MTILISWATPESAAYYNNVSLRPVDRERERHVRGPRAEQDWRSSRALIASLPRGQHVLSLSHSRGHALCASSARKMRLGIDLEYMASRDVVGLGRWVCSDAELQVLVSMTSDPDAQADYFYRLWTVKEAFVKAAGLNFPVDMRSVGFEGEPGRELRLRPPAGSWLVGVWRLDPGWMAALAWQGEIHDVRESVWRAGPGADLPLLSCLGIWHGTGV